MTSMSDILAAAQARGKEKNLPYQGALRPAEAYELLQKAPGARIVDVRTRAELDYVGRIPGSVEIEWQHYPGGQPNGSFLAYRLSLKGTRAKGSVTILAGETTAKRTKLADEILLTVLLPMIVVVALLIDAVGLAVNMSLKPVNAIRAAMARRGPQDLDPIAVQGLPEEIEPLLAETNRLMADLRAMQDSRQQFLADSAHQLRTPLAGMRAQTELSIRSLQEEDGRQALSGLLASLDRQRRLVNHLLALSRAENALADPLREAFSLEEMARHVAAEWAPRALERGIELAFECADAPARMVGNIHALSEALANLLDNSLHYCRPGDQVTVSVSNEGEKVCLAVSDTGPGVPEAALPKLFERFYRVPGSRGEGCGLGLAIVRQVALAYDGEARAMNRRGGGLEVSMCFPGKA